MTSPPKRVALVGRYGPPQIACIRSWLDQGIAVDFFHIADRGRLRFTPRRLALYFPLTPDFLSLPDAGARLRGQFDGRDAVVAVAYRELAFLRALSGADAPPCVVCAPDAEVLAFLEAKLPQIALAREVGMAVLPTWELREPGDAAAVPDDAFPLVLRPDTDVSARPGFKVERMEKRVDVHGLLDRLDAGFRVVAQPYAHGPNLVVHGYRRYDGETGDQRAFLVDWKYEGVTQRLRPAPLDAELDLQCHAFAARAGIVGVYHFEFLARAGGPPLFLEINGRLGGTTAKVRLLGYDEPIAQLRAYGVLPWDRSPGRARGGSATNRVTLAKRMIGLARGGEGAMEYPRRGRLGVAAGLAGGMLGWRDEVASLAHWRTAADFYRETLR